MTKVSPVRGTEWRVPRALSHCRPVCAAAATLRRSQETPDYRRNFLGRQCRCRLPDRIEGAELGRFASSAHLHLVAHVS